MTTVFAALLLFLLAFAGLALGVIMKRRGLRGGCGGSHGNGCCKESAAQHEQRQQREGRGHS